MVSAARRTARRRDSQDKPSQADRRRRERAIGGARPAGPLALAVSTFAAWNLRGVAEKPRRICVAHAPHSRRHLLRSSLRVRRVRSLRCSSVPCAWGTWTPHLSPRFPAAPLGAAIADRLLAAATAASADDRSPRSRPAAHRRGTFRSGIRRRPELPRAPATLRRTGRRLRAARRAGGRGRRTRAPRAEPGPSGGPGPGRGAVSSARGPGIVPIRAMWTRGAAPARHGIPTPSRPLGTSPGRPAHACSFPPRR
jgi:hypothetical protein